MRKHRKQKICAAVLIAALCFTGCVKPETNDVKDTTKEAQSTQPASQSVPATQEVKTEPQTKYTGNPNPVTKLNFYCPNKALGVRELQKGYEGPFTQGKDIIEYQIFATDAETISGGYFKRVWEEYWNGYEGAWDFKIGYEINFTVNGTEKISKNIFSPADTESYFDYIETYMYDDTHIPEGQWYSHVTESQMTDEVLLTSIKLTAGKEIDKVGDLITVTAFVYKDDKDFDPGTGKYIGTCSKTITYTRK